MDGETVELTEEQIIAQLEQGARERLGMSAEEMIESYRQGTLEDYGAVADLISFAGLLEPSHKLYVG